MVHLRGEGGDAVDEGHGGLEAVELVLLADRRAGALPAVEDRDPLPDLVVGEPGHRGPQAGVAGVGVEGPEGRRRLRRRRRRRSPSQLRAGAAMVASTGAPGSPGGGMSPMSRLRQCADSSCPWIPPWISI